MPRFLRKGTTQWKFIPTIAAASNPDGSPGTATRPEITAGTILHTQVAESAGWTLEGSVIATPDYVSTFTPGIPGEDTAPDCTITYYELDATDPIYTSQAKGTTGYLLIFPWGDAATKPMEEWPVRVTSRSREYSPGNDPARYVVGYAITSRPSQNAVTPA